MVLAVGVVALSSVLLSAVPASAWYSTGSRYCSYGYDAYTAAGGVDYDATIIHEQTNGGTTNMTGLYTHAGEVRTRTFGWQSFSASRVSQGPTRYTGCF
jgi:hypothetical protein